MSTPKYTPMIMQYLQIRDENPGVLIMYRLGDFYEFFFEDAEVVSKTLQLVLTKKSAGNNQKIPMCGIPYHAVNNYLSKLVGAGYKVGIVEQLTNPGDSKGIVERGIVQIVTPGVNLDFEESSNNYVVAIDENLTFYAISYADISTGQINVTRLDKDGSSLINFINSLEAKEVVVSKFFDTKVLNDLQQFLKVLVSYEEDDQVYGEYEKLFTNIYDSFLVKVSSRLINYLVKTQQRELTYLKVIEEKKNNDILLIDPFSATNLELTRTIRSNDKYGSLFWFLDNTKTAMGRRLLKNYILQPSRQLKEILRRQAIIDALSFNFVTREEVSKLLSNVFDFERIISKINIGSAGPRDLLRLKDSLISFRQIKEKILNINSPELHEIVNRSREIKPLIDLITNAISEETPLLISTGDVFNKGYNSQLDELINMSKDSRIYIAQLEEQEREKTGIKNLKIGYNRVFGYFIEVTNSAIDQVKDEFNYIRKQTTKNGERFINEELKRKEEQILSAEEKKLQLEKKLYADLLSIIKAETRSIQRIADIIAEIDTLVSLAFVSVSNNFVKPTFNFNREIVIKDGKHPVIDKILKRNSFVVNDIIMNKNVDVLLITGPNMGGKSTYMRQLAQIVVMAQIGSFVPAKQASLMLFDSIFTRIGATDDLISGQSTFMVEMNEANVALRRATGNSLLLFDEIGRGTATFDGMALASAMIEYVSKTIRAKTMFSTHYHELTLLEDTLDNLHNVHVEVKEEKNDITFLYKVRDGSMNKSYGINVAQLANLPHEVINRAKEVLNSLEANNPNKIVKKEVIQTNDYSPYLEEIKNIDLDSISPKQAYEILYMLQKKVLENE